MKKLNKKVLKKVGSSFLIASLLLPVGYNAYAQEKSKANYDQMLESGFETKQLFEKALESEKTVHVKNADILDRIRPDAPISESQNDNGSFTISAAASYSFYDLNRMSDAELVNTLVSMESIDDIADFWSYSMDVVDFYGDQQRIRYLLDEIEYLGSRYTANDDRGLAILIEVVNKGFLYEFDYQDPEMAYMSDFSFREEVTPAIVSVMRNSNFELGTATQDAVVSKTGFFISHATVDLALFEEALPIFQDYHSRVNTYIEETSKNSAFYGLISGLEYVQYWTYRNGPYNSENEVPWYGQIDYFFSEIAEIITFSQFEGTEHEWLVDNAVWFISEEGRFHSNTNFVLDTFERALNDYPYYGMIYIALAKKVSDLGGSINYDRVVRDYEDNYYGNEYVFDDGEFVIKAGDRVTQEEIERIYWAAKEEKAQFHRYYGVDEPVELGNADDVLTAIIYNDRDEYDINRYLNNVDTNNGGIYIESWGTFFTWDREVPTDSIYELEELFRHEYFHYLQSRYLIPGMWGSTSLYDWDRLVWVEEGGGEFFAGATRTGIDTRSTKIRNIHSDPRDRYTLDEVLHGTYGSWDIYDYSYAFYDFIAKKHMDIFDRVLELLQAEDASGFDRYMDELSRDTTLETEYQAHLDELVRDGGRVVLVGDDYTANHTDRDLSTIENDILNEIPLYNILNRQKRSDLLNTYSVEGTYEGGRSYGWSSDKEAMNTIVNDVLGSLDTRWSGYRTVTAYFVNHRVNSSGNYEFDVVFHGLLPGGAVIGTPPTAFLESPSSPVNVNETVQFYGDRSSDSDGTIISYTWNFSDGTTSNEANPTHVFPSAGDYNVTLTVEDDDGLTDRDSVTITVGDGGVIIPPTDFESEPNDRQSEANQLVDQISGTLDYASGDHTDWFYIDVDTAGDVAVDVTSVGGEINVVVEDEVGNVIARPLTDGTFNVPAGRYYVIAYTWSGELTAEYTITVNGAGNGGGDGGTTTPDTETEPNDRRSEANLLDSSIEGSLDYDAGDNQDWFYFDIDTSGNVLIDATSVGGDFNVQVEDESGNLVANLSDGSFNVSAGRYYVIVYTWSGQPVVDYTVQITK
ncbi:collagenase [Bacillus sp. SCS-151]|uniref:collagenase n=1 Tax=Nanhaiella sioensis TaxID=3115293 RepID=UPI00397D2BEC